MTKNFEGEFYQLFHLPIYHIMSTIPVTTPDKALLTWEDPARTGKVFGAIVAVLVVFKTVNLFNVFFHVAYLGLLGKYKMSWSFS